VVEDDVQEEVGATADPARLVAHRLLEALVVTLVP